MYWTLLLDQYLESDDNIHPTYGLTRNYKALLLEGGGLKKEGKKEKCMCIIWVSRYVPISQTIFDIIVFFTV